MPEETNVCPKCKAELKEGAKFCNSCGTPVGDVEVVAGLTVDKGSLTKKVKFCKVCDRNVTIKKDGTCINGHTRENLRSPIPIVPCPHCNHPYKWKTDRTCPSCGAKVPRMPMFADIGFSLGLFAARQKNIYS